MDFWTKNKVYILTETTCEALGIVYESWRRFALNQLQAGLSESEVEKLLQTQRIGERIGEIIKSMSRWVTSRANPPYS